MDVTGPPLRLLGPVSSAERLAWGGSPPLRWLLESHAFAASTSKLTIAVGEDCVGQPCVADLKCLPHLLVSGVAGSGKSTFLRAVIATLLCRCSPADLRLFLFSPDPRVFRACEGLPHLLVPPTSDPEAAAAFFEWVHHEMSRRYRVVAAAGVRTIDMFNRVPLLPRGSEAPVPVDVPHQSQMPYLLAVFDGLTGLPGRWRDGLLDPAVELCQLSRAIGIHLVMATGDLTVETLSGLLLASIPARLSFRQTRSMDSAIVLGARGSEELTEPGEALISGPPAWAPVSLRAPSVSDDALRRIVAAWRDQLPGSATPGDVV